MVSWADVVRRSCGDIDLNSPSPQLPEDLGFTAESVVDIADEPASGNLDEHVSDHVSEDLPVRDLSTTELGESSRSSPELPVLVDGSSVAAASKEWVGSNGNRRRPPPKPMIPRHGVMVIGAHRPPFYNGRGRGYMTAYPPPPQPYWETMRRPDFWGPSFRPPPHHLPPASVLNYVDPMPSRIVQQIDYYFSEPNLVKDLFLRYKMNNEGWVPISLIAGFPRVTQLTKSIPFILRSLRFSKVVEVQGDKIRKRDNWKKWIISL